MSLTYPLNLPVVVSKKIAPGTVDIPLILVALGTIMKVLIPTPSARSNVALGIAVPTPTEARPLTVPLAVKIPTLKLFSSVEVDTGPNLLHALSVV